MVEDVKHIFVPRHEEWQKFYEGLPDDPDLGAGSALSSTGSPAGEYMDFFVDQTKAKPPNSIQKTSLACN
jgi:hypothetical protein